MSGNEKELDEAIKNVFNNPNLPSYLYISNFNYLIGPGGYTDKITRGLDVQSGGSMKQKVYPLHKFDIENESSRFNQIKEKMNEEAKNVCGSLTS
jgi:hypothetical protein